MQELLPDIQMSDVPEWLWRYRQPMDGSRRWFHGTECTELRLSTGVAEKYDSGGKVLPLPGFSVVTFFGPGELNAM